MEHHIVSTKTAEIGEWYDGHPMNRSDISQEELLAYFDGKYVGPDQNASNAIKVIKDTIEADDFSLWFDDGEYEFEVTSIEHITGSTVDFSGSEKFIRGNVYTLAKHLKKVTYTVNEFQLV